MTLRRVAVTLALGVLWAGCAKKSARESSAPTAAADAAPGAAEDADAAAGERAFSVAPEPEPVLPSDLAALEEELQSLERDFARAGLVQGPAPQSAGGPAERQPSKRKTTKPAASDPAQCERICELQVAICDVAERICGLADEHEGEVAYTDACTRATGRCEQATTACDDCS